MSDVPNPANQNITPNAKRQNRLETLRAKKQALEAEIARLNAAEAGAKRKLETRKKILAGAVVLAEAEANPKVAEWLNGQLNRGLKAARDRAVFDLPPLPETKSEARRETGS